MMQEAPRIIGQEITKPKDAKWAAVLLLSSQRTAGLFNPRTTTLSADYTVVVSSIRKGKNATFSAMPGILHTVATKTDIDEIHQGYHYEGGNQLILPFGWSKSNPVEQLRLHNKGRYHFSLQDIVEPNARLRETTRPYKWLVIELFHIDSFSSENPGPKDGRQLAKRFASALGVRIRPMPWHPIEEPNPSK